MKYTKPLNELSLIQYGRLENCGMLYEVYPEATGNFKKDTMKKSNKKNYKNYQKPSDRFWKDNLMKILDCLYFEEATWAIDRWSSYGVSVDARKKIEEEFERYQKSSKQLAREEKQ